MLNCDIKNTQFRRELNFRNWGSPFGSLQDMDFFYDPHKATMLLIDTPLELQLLCLWASFLIASHKRLACQFHSFYEALHVNEKYNLRKLKKEMFISLTTRQKVWVYQSKVNHSLAANSHLHLVKVNPNQTFLVYAQWLKISRKSLIFLCTKKITTV